MKTVKVSVLQDAALDWAVALLVSSSSPVIRLHTNGKGATIYLDDGMRQVGIPFRPSRNWNQGGPIIDRERIRLDPRESSWHAQIWCEDETEVRYCTTPLIAAMRCYVASRFGDIIDIPDCLVNA